ncbi:MAG TPA: UbiA family prenyltransferase [Nocardioidaceae bacterium]|nr:UbiA family prenyltransferase [Nocardioidaceae bacterium]
MRFRKKPPLLIGLLLSAHPVMAVATSAAVTVAAALFGGRSWQELLLVAGTVLVGQLTIGWVNDIADRKRDKQAGRDDKPIAMGWVPAGTAAWTTAYATCALVPLAMTNGTEAGVSYLLAVLAGWIGTRILRRSVLSWLLIAVSYAMLPAFLSYGGSGGGSQGDPPTIALTVVAGLLGIGVHFLTSLPDLVGDNTTGMRHLPLRVAKRTGASRLLWLTGGYLIAVLIALIWVSTTVGLRQ